MSTEEHKQLIRRFYDDVWHTKGQPAYDAYLTPEATDYRQHIQGIRDAYPDVRFELGEMIAEGDTVVARWTWSGTHESDGTATGSGVSIWHLRDGKITDRWTCSDTTTVANIGHLRQS